MSHSISTAKSHVQESTRLVKIFISSTFKDMHAERDAIMKRVLPMVSMALADKSIEVRLVDLRWGINTQDVEENERENVVLQECLSEIKTSRPFFIGLLGGRYGWIPPKNNWDTMLDTLETEEQQYLVSQAQERKSVTELEILLGALMQHNTLRHSLFCFRDEAVYKTMDEVSRSHYIDEESGAQESLFALKENIKKQYQNTGYETNLINYSCEWNGQELTHLDTLVDFLVQNIVKEVLLYDCSDDSLDIKNEYEHLWVKDHQRIERSNATFVGRETLQEEILDQLNLPHRALSHSTSVLSNSSSQVQTSSPQAQNETKPKPLLYVSRDGMGKTSLLCKLYARLKEDDNSIPFIHFSDHTTLNASPETILKKWLADERLGYSKHFGLYEAVSFSELAFHFKRAVKALPASKTVVLLLDDVHLIKFSAPFQSMSWLPSNACLLGMISRTWLSVFLHNKSLDVKPFPGLTLSQAEQILKSRLKFMGKSLPQKVVEQVLSHEHKESFSATIPQWLVMMARKLTLFSSADYKAIQERKEVGEAMKIQAYLLDVVSSSKYYPETIFFSYFEVRTKGDDLEFSWLVLNFIAASKYGLLEHDLQALLGDKWSSLSYATFKRTYHDMIERHTETNQINFVYESFRTVFRFYMTDNQMFDETLSYYFVQQYSAGKDIDNVLKELPRLVIKSGQEEALKALLMDDNPKLRTQILRSLIDDMFEDKTIVWNWIRRSKGLSFYSTMSLCLDLGEELLDLKAFKLVDELIYKILDCYKEDRAEVEEIEDTYILSTLRYFSAFIAQEDGDADTVPYLKELIEDLVLEHDPRSQRLCALKAKIEFLCLKASMNSLTTHFQEVEPVLAQVLENQEKIYQDQKGDSSLYFLKKANLFRLQFIASHGLSISKHKSLGGVLLDETVYTKAKNNYELRFSGELWMFETYEHIKICLQEASFLYFAQDTFCGQLLYDEALRKSKELLTYAPKNALFFTLSFQVELVRFWRLLALKHGSKPQDEASLEEIILAVAYLEQSIPKLCAFISTSEDYLPQEAQIQMSQDMSALVVEALILLHDFCPEKYNKAYISTFIQDKVSYFSWSKGTRVKVQSTLYQYGILYGLELEEHFSSLDCALKLELAQDLLFMRHDLKGAEYFLHNVLIHDLSSFKLDNALNVRYNLLHAMLALSLGDYNVLIQYHKTLLSFCSKIPSLETFIEVHDFLRLWNMVHHAHSDSSPQWVMKAYNVYHGLQTALEQTTTDTENSLNLSLELRLQLSFYHLCSHLEINVPILLSRGETKEAGKMISLLKTELAVMKGKSGGHVVLTTAYSLAYATMGYFAEQRGEMQEALYFSRQLEYVLYTLYHKYPNNDEIKRRYASAMDDTGRLFLIYFHAKKEADTCFKQSAQLFKALYQKHPSGEILNDWLVSRQNIMMALYMKKAYAEAIIIGEETLQDYEDLGPKFVAPNSREKADTSNTMTSKPVLKVRLLGSLYDSLSDLYSEVEDYEKQGTMLNLAHEIFSTLMEEDSDNELLLRDYAQNGLRKLQFLDQRLQDYKTALELISQIDVVLDKASKMLEESIKIKQIFSTFLLYSVRIKLHAQKIEDALREINRYLEFMRHEIEENNAIGFIPLLWAGLDLLFEVTLELGLFELAQNLVSLELKFKRSFIQKKMIKEEEAKLGSITQKVEYLQRFQSKD